LLCFSVYIYFTSFTEFISEICFNLGKKSGGQKEEQATGGKPKLESAQETEVSGKERTGPLWPQQQKKCVEPALKSGGGDTTAGPSQQPQGERQKQRQSQKQATHVAGKEGGKKKGQAGSGNLILFIVFVMLTVIYICQHMHTIKLEVVHKPNPSYIFE
jgi:hypothetical protein